MANDKFRNYIGIDFETTDLYRSIYKQVDINGIAILLSPREAYRYFGHIATTQFAYYDESVSKRVQHYSINFNSSDSSKLKTIKGSRRIVPLGTLGRGKVPEEFRGIPVNVERRRLYSQQDVISELTRDGSKIKGRTRDSLINSKYPDVWARRSEDTIFSFTMPDGTQKVLSKFALKDQISSGELFLTTKDAPSAIRKQIEDLGTIDFFRISQQEYAGKGSGSLYSVVDSILSKATKDNPYMFGGWNPFFDMNQMMSDMIKFGYVEKAQEFYQAYRNGIIQIDEVEKYWQALVYQLAKEDSSFAKMFKVPFTPEATSFTGRPGKIAKGFEETKHAIPWSADFVSKIFKKHLGMDLKQLHAAGPDVQNEILYIKKAIVGILDKRGLTAEGIIKGDLQGNISSLIEDELSKHGSTLSAFKRDIATGSQRKFIAAATPTNTAGHMLVDQIKGAGKRWGGVAAVLGLAFFATYGLGGEDDMYPFSKKISFNKMNPNIPSYRSYLEDDPNYTSHIGKVIGGVSAPLIGLYTTGLFSRWNAPKLFGVDHGSFENYAKDVIGNIIYGAKRIEGSFPMARVFKFGAMADYIGGRKKPFGNITKPGLSDDVSEIWSFYNIKNGNIVSPFGPRGKGVKWENKGHGYILDDLIDAAKITMSDKEFARFEAVMKGELSQSFNQQIRIGRLKEGGTVVYADRFSEDGVKVGSDRFHVKASVMNSNLREYNPAMGRRIFRGDNAKDTASWVNSINYEFAQRQAVKHGIARKLTEEEYLKNLKPNDFIKRHPGFKGLYTAYEKIRYHLELLPKGVGQAENKLYEGLADNLNRSTNHIRVTGLTDEFAYSWQSAKFAYMNTVMPFRSAFLSSMNTFFESPLEFIGIGSNKVDGMVKTLKRSRSPVANFAGTILSGLNRPHLGLSMYGYKYGAPEYFMKVGLKRVLPAFALFGGLSALDHAIGAATLSPTGQGPIATTAIKAWQSVHLAYAKISDITGFTRIAKKQEKWAPGSTGIGFFAPALSAVSIYKGMNMAYNHGPSIIKETVDKYGKYLANKSMVSKYIKPALRREPYKGALKRGNIERFLSYALKNPKKAIFGFMMLPSLPFIPGLLGSNKSYKELRAEYKGEKEVAVRKYRGWLLSSSPFGGGKPIQFRRHASNIIESDYQNRGVVWPSYWSKLAHHATLGMYGRYMLEDYHKDSQPVYESSPYGANIPFIGPIIASTIGKVVKPTVSYHDIQNIGSNIGITPYQPTTKITQESIDASRRDSNDIAMQIGLNSPNSNNALYQRWISHYRDLIGFRGFVWETTKQFVTGKNQTDEFTPYRQSAIEMYNPAQTMWSFRAGDITGIGGEMLRRIFPYPRKQWEVNDIRNELYGISWIPQKDSGNEYRTATKDFTHGTTFDNIPMGWLYATRKGWEFLYPEVRGLELEQYPDPVRLEILQSIAPYSKEFRETASKVGDLALSNGLDPSREQRYYETLDQVRQLRDQIYDHASELSYELETEKKSGRISSVGTDGSFTIEGSGHLYRLAGVSTDTADIRYSLLQKRKFDTAQDLDDATRQIQDRTSEIINKALRVGSHISFDIAAPDQMSYNQNGIEAIIGGLNEELIDAGASFKNTGNLSSFNLQQQKEGIYASMMQKYWGFLTNDDSFFNKKLISQRDYLNHYKSNQVFNREVKLWSRPIEHILKPFIASVAHRLGFNAIPGFTAERRKKQEYWDMIKYIKYKSLAVQAAKEGNLEDAEYYHNMWRRTMIGADPTDENERDEIAALPSNERAYYNRFVSEPDPKKRGEIYKYLPRAAKRLYSAIWNKRIAMASDDPEQQRLYQNLKETEGWGMTKKEAKMYQRETGGLVTKGDWIRARVVEEFIRNNPIPEADSIIWSKDVDIENVELLALREQGENIQDYGYFEEKARVAAYDALANAATIELKSVDSTSRATRDTILSYIIQDDRTSSIEALPTMSSNATKNINIVTNGHDRFVRQSASQYGNLISDMFAYEY